MNELSRRAVRGLPMVPNRDEREHNKVVDRLVRDTRLAGLRVDAEAALAGRVMERAVDLDQHRRALAGDDPTLNQVLVQVELGFVDKCVRVQKSFGSEFPL